MTSTARVPPQPSRLLVVANLAIVYLVFGSTYLAIRVMVETIPPLLGAGIRFAVAGALLYGWCALRRLRVPRLTWREFGGTALIGLLVIGGGLGLLTVGEQSVPSGLAALLVASVPAWVALLRAVHHDHVPGLTWAGVALGLAGVALLGGISGATGAAAVTGVVLLLVAALSEAAGSYCTARFPLPHDALAAAAVQMLVAGPVLGIAGLLLGEPLDRSAWSGRSLLGLLYLIGPGSVLAYASFVWLVSRTPTSIATTYTYVNPPVALVLGWLILDEEITFSVVVGAVLILVGVVAILAAERRTTGDARRPPTEV